MAYGKFIAEKNAVRVWWHATTSVWRPRCSRAYVICSSVANTNGISRARLTHRHTNAVEEKKARNQKSTEYLFRACAIQWRIEKLCEFIFSFVHRHIDTHTRAVAFAFAIAAIEIGKRASALQSNANFYSKSNKLQSRVRVSQTESKGQGERERRGRGGKRERESEEGERKWGGEKETERGRGRERVGRKPQFYVWYANASNTCARLNIPIVGNIFRRIVDDYWRYLLPRFHELFNCVVL